MGCDEIKPPPIPEMDTSKLKGNLPAGRSLSDLKAPVSKATLSDSLKGAGGLIGSNVKKLGDSLSPAGIADRVGDAVGAIADGITSRVEAAVDGLSNLKDRITGFDPMAKAKSFVPNSPEDTLNSVKSKVSGPADALASRAAAIGKDCGKQFPGKAAGVGTALNDKAKTKAREIPAKDRLQANKSPEVKQAQQNKIAQDIKTETQDEITTAATKPDKETRTVQQESQSDSVTVTVKTDHPCSLAQQHRHIHYMHFLYSNFKRRFLEIQQSTRAILNSVIYFPDEKPPGIDAWNIVRAGAQAITYLKLMDATMSSWDSLGCKAIDEKGAKTMFDKTGWATDKTFSTYIQSQWPSAYANGDRTTYLYRTNPRVKAHVNRAEFLSALRGEFLFKPTFNIDSTAPVDFAGSTGDDKKQGLISISGFGSSETAFQLWWKHWWPAMINAVDSYYGVIDKTQQEIQEAFNYEMEPQHYLFEVPNNSNIDNRFAPNFFAIDVELNPGDIEAGIPMSILNINYPGEDGFLQAAINI